MDAAEQMEICVGRAIADGELLGVGHRGAFRMQRASDEGDSVGGCGGVADDETVHGHDAPVDGEQALTKSANDELPTVHGVGDVQASTGNIDSVSVSARIVADVNVAGDERAAASNRKRICVSRETDIDFAATEYRAAVCDCQRIAMIAVADDEGVSRIWN